MPNLSMMGDRVSILKRNGVRIDEVNACVLRDMIIIKRSDMIIEMGDLIIRQALNKDNEIYEVLKPVFFKESQFFTASYHIEIKRLSVFEGEEIIQDITQNIDAVNAGVNRVWAARLAE